MNIYVYAIYICVRACVCVIYIQYVCVGACVRACVIYMSMYILLCTYGVATISRLLQIIVLFCKREL